MINADNINAEFLTATVREAQGVVELVIVDRSGAALTAAMVVTPATPWTLASATDAASVTLFGNPVQGEIWTVNLGELDWAYPTAAAPSLAGISAELANRIVADTRASAAVLTAVADGSVLYLVRIGAEPIAPEFTFTPASGYTIDAVQPSSVVATLDTTATAGRWRMRSVARSRSTSSSGRRTTVRRSRRRRSLPPCSRI
jgi:hypothetical protein